MIVQRLAERLDLGAHRVDVLGVLVDVRMRALADPAVRDAGLPAQALGVGDRLVQLGLGLLVPVLVEGDFFLVVRMALGQRLRLDDVLADLIAVRTQPHQLAAGGDRSPGDRRQNGNQLRTESRSLPQRRALRSARARPDTPRPSTASVWTAPTPSEAQISSTSRWVKFRLQRSLSGLAKPEAAQ